ncbi:MAG: RNA ligase family protein [Myxococcota bacterium]
MSWKFTGYDKIPGATRSWNADEGDLRRLARIDWIVMEKIHGANFCFIVDANTIQTAKRRAILKSGEPFFHHQRLRDRLEGPLRRLFDDNGESGARLMVYGELFGGGYPHPDVAPIAGVQPVQTGVWYCPDVAFVAFDVVEERDGERRWWGYDRFSAQLEHAGVPWLSARFVGRYADAFAQNPIFQTEVPARFQLPALPDNFAEGVVIKPAEHVLVNGARPMTKRKHPRFEEDKRFHQAKRWTASTAPAVSPLDTLEFAMLNKVTTQRWAAARSKLGPAATDEAMLEEFVNDVMADLEEELPDALAGLSAEDRALLVSALEEEAQALRDPDDAK